jgi:hypothetical protein
MDKTLAYLKDIEPETRWHGDELLVFIYAFQVEDFVQALDDDGGGIFDDGGLEVILKSGYMVIDMAEVCSYFDEDPEEILKRDPED